MMYEMRDVIIFAYKAHEGQVRKYTENPYIVHPISVGFILASITQERDVIAAGILHDVLEDTDRTESDILTLCNQRVLDFVLDVTDTSKPSDGNRKVRKQIDLEHLAEAKPESKTIKLADIIDNGSNIAKYDPGFAKIWLGEKKRLLPHLIQGHPVLYWRVDSIISAYERGK